MVTQYVQTRQFCTTYEIIHEALSNCIYSFIYRSANQVLRSAPSVSILSYLKAHISC